MSFLENKCLKKKVLYKFTFINSQFLYRILLVNYFTQRIYANERVEGLQHWHYWYFRPNNLALSTVLYTVYISFYSLEEYSLQ